LLTKVIVIFGTRPEAIKLAPLVQELKKNTDIKTKIIVSAQHRDMLDQVLRLFSIDVEYDLNIMTHNQSLYHVTSKVILELEQILNKERPSLVIVQGDTTTTFASSLAAYYQKIPIAHVEAGLRTEEKYSPFPEEINRRLTTHMADFHFAPTENAKRALLNENIPEDRIWVTGNTVVDALKMILERKHKFNDSFLQQFEFTKKKLILVTLHRRESFAGGLENVLVALNEIAQKENVDIIYPVHPNPNVRTQVSNMLSGVGNVYLVDPLPYDEFIFLMSKSYLIITDSGGIQEEVCTLNKPALVTRDKTEREEAIAAGFAKLVGYDTQLIIKEISRLLNNKNYYYSMCDHANPFGDGVASKKIVNILFQDQELE